MSVRMQIYLSRDQYNKLREKSRLTGKPMSQYIRESLGKYLDEADQVNAQPGDPIWNLAGKGESDSGDLSTKHDQYLYTQKKGDHS